MKIIDHSSPQALKPKTGTRPISSADVDQTRRGKIRADRVSISPAAQAAEAAVKKIKAMPAVDMDKVAKIKSMLQNGTYTVDADKAASTLLTEALLKDR